MPPNPAFSNPLSRSCAISKNSVLSSTTQNGSKLSQPLPSTTSSPMLQKKIRIKWVRFWEGLWQIPKSSHSTSAAWNEHSSKRSIAVASVRQLVCRGQAFLATHPHRPSQIQINIWYCLSRLRLLRSCRRSPLCWSQNHRSQLFRYYPHIARGKFLKC